MPPPSTASHPLPAPRGSALPAPDGLAELPFIRSYTCFAAHPLRAGSW